MDRICHVIGGGEFCPERFAPKDDDFIIAADAGYELLENIGITPHITIGDFDSLGFVPNVQRIVLPTVKDDTPIAARNTVWRSTASYQNTNSHL